MRLRKGWRPLAGTRACSLNGQPNSKAGEVGFVPAEDWSGWRLKNEASLHAYSTPCGRDVFGRFAGAIGPMNTGKRSGDGDAGGPPTPSTPNPSGTAHTGGAA